MPGSLQSLVITRSSLVKDLLGPLTFNNLSLWLWNTLITPKFNVIVCDILFFNLFHNFFSFFLALRVSFYQHHFSVS